LAGKSPSSGNAYEKQTPISLLTTPVVLFSSTSALQFETNAIHNNGATISLCSQEVADAIGLDGEFQPLGLAVFGNPNQVQQAFKTTVAIADAEGIHIGNAMVHVVDEFVKVRAVDWPTHLKDIPHLRSPNFEKLFREGRCHILLGNNNHHLTQGINNISAQRNPQLYPYATLTPLGWCAAGPSLPPIRGDHLFNIMAKTAAQEKAACYTALLKKIQDKLYKMSKPDTPPWYSATDNAQGN
jgi:hypothetical protein